ncbi:hypothetical protein CCR75_001369 [Bremia lactucae]|uniref:CWF19-like protein 2 n=1 Tax=Bremia lactucae TaxID=4779 RepID=A0A976FFA7_BRELC|nr:hypothetical protein CCR75_001369 [Bremia lactucae]
MSSLLQGLKFVKRVEGDEKLQKPKKKKKRQQSFKTHHHKDEKIKKIDRASRSEDDNVEHEVKENDVALVREDWMTMPFLRPRQDCNEPEKSLEEVEVASKQKKIQDEIDAGIREPVTGMVYGLYDPKKPDATPRISVNSVLNDTINDENLADQDAKIPLFGDGGASWRAKMLKHAEAKARASGVALKEIVQERFGSIAALKESAKRSARDDAHLKYTRRKEDESVWKGGRAKGREGKDKTLLSKYSARLQRSMTHDGEDTSRREGETKRYHDRSFSRRRNEDQEEDEPIDYDQLPGVNVDFKAGRCEDENSDSRGCDRKSSRQEKHGRTRSRSRDRLATSKKPRRSNQRLRSRSRQRSESPAKSKITRGLSNDERNLSGSATIEEKVSLPREVHVKESAIDTLALTNRRAFLYGTKKSSVLNASRSEQPLKSQGSDVETTSSLGSLLPKREAKYENDTSELNKLAAKALRAQMMGKTALFHKLTDELNELEAKLEHEKTATAIPHFEAIAGALPPFEKEDMRDGPYKGKKKRHSAQDTDVDASLEELVREERMAKIDHSNMDSTHARNIMRLGSHYKGHQGKTLISGFEEDEEVDPLMVQDPTTRLTRRARVQREQNMAVNETKRWDARTQKCQLCMKSPGFKKLWMLSLGEYTYLALPSRRQLHPRHCVIVPIDHTCSFAQADEQVCDEIRRFQAALATMCEHVYNMSIVFLEQTSAPDRKRHTLMECIPIDSNLAMDMPLYFKQELLQANSDWSTHQAIIDTNQGGIKRHVPPTFPYFHIEWHSRNGRGGYAHVIEDDSVFPRNFGVNVVAGLLDVMPTRRQEGHLQYENRRVLDFLKDWKAFDWTQSLEGGELTL